MFKFNFTNEKESSEFEFADKNDKVLWYNSKEIKIPPNINEIIKSISRDQIINLDYGHGITFSCLSAKEVMNMLKEKSDNEQFLDVLKADGQHSDLLPGQYEGGLKTWECTKDLTAYFGKDEIEKLNHKLEGKNVLDLGCGTGILGIMCLLKGANVMFQDYNQEVLESMTIPNIFLNCDSSFTHKVKLFSGDWSSFLDVMVQENDDLKFDYILTSETIYNPQNYKKIINIFKKLLKPEGLAFVAAKTHYFGVGGTLREFENQLQENAFSTSVCWKTSEGVAREILKVEFQK